MCAVHGTHPVLGILRFTHRDIKKRLSLKLADVKISRQFGFQPDGLTWPCDKTWGQAQSRAPFTCSITSECKLAVCRPKLLNLNSKLLDLNPNAYKPSTLTTAAAHPRLSWHASGVQTWRPSFLPTKLGFGDLWGR